MQIDDRDVLPSQTRDRGAHVVEGDRADVAEILRHDDVRARLPEPFQVDFGGLIVQ